MIQSNNFPTIGVTGITGSGTSTVSAMLAERGAYVAHADKLAHDAMSKTEPAFKEIIETFGREILTDKGEINRRALGARVFGNKEDMARLEKIIHPRVIERTRAIVKKLSDMEEYTFVVIDAPLLIESGMATMCDSIWLITAPNDLRIARITARDKIDENAAKRRLQSRNPESTLREHAHIIIENDGSPIALRSKTETALKGMKLRIHGWEGCKVLEI
ncbi:MAG: dephospho-CoA kinase [Defluviitaleaceae bacterium]|nr:dephospho-CoA kinase [Defluviitaleaceae bacterium]MCL2262105.1 dephospho-CoA kinase [Defluviitaleaceae bacterium]